MKPLSAVLILVGSIAIPAYGQSTQPGQWRSRPDSVETASKKTPAQLLQEALLRVPTLEEMHGELRTHSNLHDTYLYIAKVGNEQSVPLLLERLRKDYGASEPKHVPGLLEGFDCAQVHLIEALRTITNSDQGMYYPRWAAWWEKNQNLSQDTWLRNGFAVAGLHFSEPIDERFGLELIKQTALYRDYRVSLARRMLAKASREELLKWATLAAASGDRFSRLGAIAIFRQIAGSVAGCPMFASPSGQTWGF